LFLFLNKNKKIINIINLNYFNLNKIKK